MSEMNLTSNSSGAENSSKALSGVNVQANKVIVGEAEHKEMEQTEAKDVEVGVFMDGTWNNRNNTAARKEYEKMKRGEDYNSKLASDYIAYKNDDIASYESDYSNIARMEPYYKEEETETGVRLPVYIEGVGTKNGEKDSGLGGGFGIGSTGIPAKMKNACEDIVKKLNDNGITEVNTLSIDVFGFSRGAAAARHFVHEVFKSPREATYHARTGSQVQPKQHKHGYLGKLLEEKKISFRWLTVRFVGLYDTVSSHGVGVIFDYDNDTEALHLDAIRNARFTLQLTAADEHRRNFSLININSAVSRDRGEEYALPGVHADVGGCYVDAEEETRIFQYDERDYVLEEGWYTDDQIDVIEMQRERGQAVRFIEGTRTLPNTYSHIPLTIMADKMIEKELPLKSNQLKAKYIIPNELDNESPGLGRTKKRIFDYVFNDGPALDFRPVEELNQKLANDDISRKAHRKQLKDSIMLMKLRNDYLHFSAEFGDLVNKPNRTFWTGRREREINNG